MRKNPKPMIFSMMFVFLASICSFAQAPSDKIAEFSRPFLRKFTDTNGLPINSVMSLERDLRGFLWVGTQDGAAYFNGHRWTNVILPNRTISNYVYTILAAKDGAIWIGTDGGGLHRFQNGEWKTYDSGSGLISNNIRTIYETFDESGKQIIWIGTRDGLSRFDGENFQNFDISNGLPKNTVRSLLETGDKSLWIGTTDGIAIWKNTEKRIFNKENGFPYKTVFSLLETKNQIGESIVWAGTDGGLAKFENGIWTTFEKEKLPLTGVRSLGKSTNFKGEETIWVGFDGQGLSFFENGIWRNLNEKNGLANDLVFAIEDAGTPDGSIWLSTLGAGIARLERSNWSTFDDRNGLANKIVFGIGQDAANAYWIGTYGGGAMRFAEGIWTKFDTSKGLPNDYVHCFLATKNEADKDIFYIGTERGLGKLEDGKITKVDLSAEKIEEIWDLHESIEADGSKTLWVVAGGGLVRINRGKTTVYTTKEGLPEPRLRSVLETVSANGEKTLWFATFGGLAKFEKESFTVFNTNNGLPNNRVYSLAEIKDDSARQLWVGTGGGGVAILNLDSTETTFQKISTETGNLLPNDSVLQIFQDAQKRVYLTTNKGVARLTPKNKLNSLDFQSYIFTTEDGLPSNECISGASFVDSDGNIWVGTVGGAALLDLKREFPDSTSDKILLEKVLVGGKERKLINNVELPYNENNLVFDYTLLSNFRESGTRYRTQLVGLEDKPTDWTSESSREFNFLPDGNFLLKVWGMDASGNISEPLEIPFRIRPAWWRTWWAYLLYFVAFAGIISLIGFGIYRNRLLRLIELERVRNRIATDLHDDIGASLSQISILSEILANDPQLQNEDERQSLAKIADTSREVTSSMSDIVWAINPNRDNVADLVQRMRHFASDILSAKDIDFAFFAPIADENRKIDVDLRRQIYLVFKEAINNAAKHSKATEIEINFNETNGFYDLQIKDNGTGFETKNGELNPNLGGNGLMSMRSRAEAVGGKLEIVSDVNTGTEIILKVPTKQ